MPYNSRTLFALRNDSEITRSTELTIHDRKSKSYLIRCTDPRYYPTLEEHNIAISPCTDPIIHDLSELILADCSNQWKEGKSIEERWKFDKSRCARSNEAKFQRTVMMDILDRHKLNENTDYDCEAPWHSRRFPCRDCSAEQCRISMPTPDLAVGFRSNSLLMDDEVSVAWTRLKSLEGHIFPEGTTLHQKDRAFHFFSMEVKGKRGTLDNKTAQAQNLNTASQALYNIYRCMKEANELNLFFEEIRVFSAVATVEGFWLRVHRAIKVNERQHNNKDYPIGFEFDEVIELGKSYTRKRVSGIVANVLLKYGVEKLHPIMKRIVKILLDRASVEGTQLSQENVRSVPTDTSSLAALNITPASQVSTNRKRDLHDGMDASSEPRKRRGRGQKILG